MPVRYVRPQELQNQTTIAATNPGSSGSFSVEMKSPEFATREEAETYAAMFPKSVRARVRVLGGNGVVYYVVIDAYECPGEGTMGAKNETGTKRIRRAIEILRKNGIAVRHFWADRDMPVAEIESRFF
jgi:hypothetical protein